MLIHWLGQAVKLMSAKSARRLLKRGRATPYFSRGQLVSLRLLSPAELERKRNLQDSRVEILDALEPDPAILFGLRGVRGRSILYFPENRSRKARSARRAVDRLRGDL